MLSTLQKTQDSAIKLRSRERPDQDLTPGQAAALLNTEKAIDRLQQELDDLEETMQESMRDSIHGRQAQYMAWQRKKRTRHHAASDSDGDDEYFDRTQHKKSKSKAQAVSTVTSLLNKLQELQAEELRLNVQLQVLHSHPLIVLFPLMYHISGICLSMENSSAAGSSISRCPIGGHSWC